MCRQGLRRQCRGDFPFSGVVRAPQDVQCQSPAARSSRQRHRRVSVVYRHFHQRYAKVPTTRIKNRGNMAWIYC